MLVVTKAEFTIEEKYMEQWERKRSRAMKAFTCQAAALGMEYSLTFITLWLYLETLIKEEQIVFFYSIVSAAYLSSQVLTSIIFGRIVDRYRNVSLMFFIGNSLIIVGNILYTLPFSSWCLVAGRFLSGGGGCLRSIMTSEIARSFPEEKLSSKFALMGMAFGLGFVLGPAINFAFINANFWIGSVHITYANAPGLYLAVIFIMVQIMAIFLVSDLSKEYDLKQHYVNKILLNEKEPLLGNNDRKISKKKNRISSCIVLNAILKHFDTFLILAFSFTLMYCLVAMDLWQPLIVVELMKWGVLELNIIIFYYGFAAVVIMLLLSYRPLSNHHMVYFSILCTLSITVLLLIVVTFTLYHTNLVLNIILWVVYGTLTAVVVVMEEIFLIGIMAKMTSSSVQAFTESIRLAASRSGALMALLSAAPVFPYLHYFCACLATLTFIGAAVLFCRRKPFQNPKILIHVC